MKRSWLIVIGVAWPALLFGGCGPKPVAKVNGLPITHAEFVKALEHGVGLMQGPEGLGAGRRILDAIIVRHLVEKEAREKQVSVSEAELKKALGEFKKNFQAGYGRPYEQFLQATGATEAELAEQLKFSLLLRKLTVTQTEIEEYFRARPQEFDKPEQVTYYQMFLPSKEAALAARSEVEKGKIEFALLAREKSLSKAPFYLPPGGVLNTAEKGRVVDPDPNLEEILFSLSPGKTSEPIPLELPAPVSKEAPKGKMKVWRLLQIVSHQKEQKATLQNSREEVSRRVFAAKAASGQLAHYISSLRAQARLEIIDPRYGSLGEEYKRIAKEMPRFQPPRPPLPGEAPAPAPGESNKSSP